MNDQRKSAARRAAPKRPMPGVDKMVERVMNERAARRAALVRLRERERAARRRSART